MTVFVSYSRESREFVETLTRDIAALGRELTVGQPLMPLLIPIIGISALAAYLLRGTWLFVPALVNAIANLWSLGSIWTTGGAPNANNYDRVVSLVSILSSVAGMTMLIASFFVTR